MVHARNANGSYHFGGRPACESFDPHKILSGRAKTRPKTHCQDRCTDELPAVTAAQKFPPTIDSALLFHFLFQLEKKKNHVNNKSSSSRLVVQQTPKQPFAYVVVTKQSTG